MTDDFASYKGLDDDYAGYKTVDHSSGEYVRKEKNGLGRVDKLWAI
jgi:hypothetical protein